MSPTIVGNSVANCDGIDLVKAELIKLIEITRAEQSYIRYDLHHDNNNPNQLMSIENWETHMSAPIWPLICKQPTVPLRHSH